MMNTKALLSIFIFSMCMLYATHAFSQIGDPHIDSLFNSMTDIESRLRTIDHEHFTTDSIIPDTLQTRKPNGTLILPRDRYDIPLNPSLTFRDTMFYNSLFLPIIFNGKTLQHSLDKYTPFASEKQQFVLIDANRTFAPRLQHNQFVQRIRNQYYVENPQKMDVSIYELDKIPGVATDEYVVEQYNPFKELLSTEMTASIEAPDVQTVKTKRIYWVKSGEHALQFSQNYFSENWHKSGSSNLNINSIQVMRANYRKDKVRFNNTLEWRLSLLNAPEDTLREVRIAEDMIRYYGDFGIDAYKKVWSYSANLEAKSQIFNNHPQNSDELRSAFLAPLYVNAGIGMKYAIDKKSKKVRHRRTRFELSMAPFSMNYKYVGNDKVDVKRYGIPEEKNWLLDFGSTITAILTYNYNKYITWNSRFKYFTDYKKVESELENSLNMSLSSYFSTRIYLHLRFDDSVPADPKYRYLQVHETLSFGLNYKW